MNRITMHIHRYRPTLGALRLTLAALLACVAMNASGTCSFNSAASPITFTALDPSAATTRTAFLQIVVKCTSAGTPPIWLLSGGNGNSPKRMKHATRNAFIPYSAAPVFVSRQGSNQTWRLTATILGQDYIDAFVGAYSDFLTVTVLP